ncbi:MAG: DUF721 domain-containing protein [Gammaproteobacteria bacterium]|nr:DUF721 domain-containing protein [Gammaproteobacteria bacterium]
MKKTPKTVTDILGQGDNDLSRLMRRAKALNNLNETIRRMLPPNLIDHCSVANIRNKQLIILAESATWATLLRYEQGNILAQLHENPKYNVIESIKVKIAPVEQAPDVFYRRAQAPSSHSRQAMLSLAENIEDEDLRASIARLAKSVDRD